MDGMTKTLKGAVLGELKLWRCLKNKKHVLGVIEYVKVRVTVNGESARYHTSRLSLFREAVDTEAGIPDEVGVIGTIDTNIMLRMGWACTVPGCGCVREWNPDEEGLAWLYTMIEKRREGIDS